MGLACDLRYAARLKMARNRDGEKRKRKKRERANVFSFFKQEGEAIALAGSFQHSLKFLSSFHSCG
jgi:hypothetical protein